MVFGDKSLGRGSERGQGLELDGRDDAAPFRAWKILNWRGSLELVRRERKPLGVPKIDRWACEGREIGLRMP